MGGAAGGTLGEHRERFAIDLDRSVDEKIAAARAAGIVEPSYARRLVDQDTDEQRGVTAYTEMTSRTGAFVPSRHGYQSEAFPTRAAFVARMASMVAAGRLDGEFYFEMQPVTDEVFEAAAC